MDRNTYLYKGLKIISQETEPFIMQCYCDEELPNKFHLHLASDPEFWREFSENKARQEVENKIDDFILQSTQGFPAKANIIDMASYPGFSVIDTAFRYYGYNPLRTSNAKESLEKYIQQYFYTSFFDDVSVSVDMSAWWTSTLGEYGWKEDIDDTKEQARMRRALIHGWCKYRGERYKFFVELRDDSEYVDIYVRGLEQEGLADAIAICLDIYDSKVFAFELLER